MYGSDLRVLLWGPGAVGCRRLLALIEKLPADSATVLEARALAVQQEAAPTPSVRDAIRGFFGGGE